jgi:hypothetical protein
MLGRAAVTDHQASPFVAGRRARPGAVVLEPVDGQAVLASPGDGGALGVRPGKFQDRVQARGDAGDPLALPGQGGGQAVPAAAVGEPGPADLPVVAARGDELGQRQLVERGWPGGEFRRHRLEQPGRDDQPAEPQARRQALAGRASVDDMVGRQRLQRAHRLPVVAELPVVVVLDHHPAPVGHLPAAPRMQRHAQRELVRGGEQRRVRPGGLADDGAHPVDGHGPQAQALPGGDVAMSLVAVGLHREGARAGRAQRAADPGQAVREAGADDDVRGIGGHPPRPGQVVSQRRAQLRQPARVRIAEQVIGGRGEDLAGGREPGPARERGQVGHPGPQIVAGHRHPGLGRDLRARLGCPARRDGRAGSGPCGQPSLGDQLAVDLGDRVAGDAQVRGQGPGRGQSRARAQAPGPDRAAQRALQPGPHPGPGQVQVQVHAAQFGPGAAVIFGPRFLHRNGSYLGPLGAIASVS